MIFKASFVLFLASSTVSAQLHSLAVRAGLDYFGTALDERRVTSDTAYRAIYLDTTEFGQVVPENGQKWQNVQPSRGSFTYTQGDIVSHACFMIQLDWFGSNTTLTTDSKYCKDE